MLPVRSFLQLSEIDDIGAMTQRMVKRHPFFGDDVLCVSVPGSETGPAEALKFQKLGQVSLPISQ